jgi:hypothetical protein
MRKQWLALGIAIVGLVPPGCAPKGQRDLAGPVDTGPMTLAAARRYLEGRWALESFEVHEPGKAPIRLKGEGTLTYDNMSNLRMEIRADQESADALRAGGIDIRDGLISTDGFASVDLQNRTLTYRLDKQTPLIRGPLGMHRPRHWEVTEDTLTLTTKDDEGRPLSVGRWKRVR